MRAKELTDFQAFWLLNSFQKVKISFYPHVFFECVHVEIANIHKCSANIWYSREIILFVGMR